MRTAYHEQLAELSQQLGEMCRLAGAAMEHATQALLQADLVLAEQVMSDHEKIAELSTQAEESAFVLLALQAPVAGDLRSIVSAIQMVADIDRMGALALHVAKIARRRHPQHALPEEVNGYFAEMGRLAVELGNSAQEVLPRPGKGRAHSRRRRRDGRPAPPPVHRIDGSGVEARGGLSGGRDVAWPVLRAVRRSRRRGGTPGHLPGDRSLPRRRSRSQVRLSPIARLAPASEGACPHLMPFRPASSSGYPKRPEM
jgi:phosphate transport system regulatory protein PhoU